MKLQISSGQGPEECELAVAKLVRALQKEYESLCVEETVAGRKSDTFQSVVLSSKEDLSFLCGTVQWKCQSPYRKHHKRKNWFVHIHSCEEAEQEFYDQSLVKIETFRSGGKGGQHVNKVETGVRATYLPTGISVVSTEERSQSRNKSIALGRLSDMILEQNQNHIAAIKQIQRLEHFQLERGNAVRIYEGLNFTRVK